MVTGRSEAACSTACLPCCGTCKPDNRWPNCALASSPRIQYRMLNHWDNPNGTVERGYAGSSIWKWYELPDSLDPRYTDYARANASIGINGVVSTT